MNINRRSFLKHTALASLGLPFMLTPRIRPNLGKGYIMTVNGRIDPAKMGIALTHEHVLVDFIKGAAGKVWWDRQEVVNVVLPYLEEVKQHGCKTFFEFTPSYIGKDVRLLKELATRTGLNIITNTGYYGARNNDFIPAHAYEESAEQLAARWTKDFKEGMQGTKVKPGFVKIGVAPGPLSVFHQKLVKAAALTHLETGLTIASHTGPAEPALEEIEIFKENGAHPSAFIWTHAQNEKDLSTHIRAAKMGTWISLDGIRVKKLDQYLAMLQNLKENKQLNRVLLSHDAGWYRPGEEKGSKFRGYTTLFTHLLPLLKENGFSREEIDQLLVKNPVEAFTINVRRTTTR